MIMTDRTCAELIEGFDHTIIGDPGRTITGITYRSDAVQPGEAFCCIVGMKSDGHAYAQDAVDRGAGVLVVERELDLKGGDHVTFILVDDSRKAMAHLAARFYRMPSQDLSLVGITGTNGKTTTTFLVDHIARTLGATTGLIGTVGIDIAGKELPADHRAICSASSHRCEMHIVALWLWRSARTHLTSIACGGAILQ